MSDHEEPAPAESRKISVLLKVYGVYCLITAAAVLVLLALIAIPLVQYGADLFRERHDVTLTMTLVVIQLVTMLVASVGYVAFGVLVLRNRRRHVAQIAYALLAVGIVNLILEIMLNGFGDNLIYDGVRLLVLLVISATIDPTLITERQPPAQAARHGDRGGRRGPARSAGPRATAASSSWTSSTCSGSLWSAACSASSSRPSTTWSSWTRASTRTAPACSTGPSRPSTALARCS